MIEAITTSFNAIKGGLDIAQGIQSLKNEAAISQAVIDIQRSLLEAQRGLNEAETRHAADLARIRELEQEIMSLKDWAAESERYEPVDIYLGTIAYMPKLGVKGGEPAHWLCPNCFQQGRKSFLVSKGQVTNNTGGLGLHRTWGCDACGLNFQISYQRNPQQSQQDRIEAAAAASQAE